MDNAVKNLTPRTIFVIVDGLRDDAASRSFGFLEGLVDSGAGSRWSAEAVLPSVIAPSVRISPDRYNSGAARDYQQRGGPTLADDRRVGYRPAVGALHRSRGV